MGKKVNKPRPLAKIEEDMKRAARRCDNMLILLAVLVAAAAAWMTTPDQRALLTETWRQDAITRRLCQAYVGVSPDKAYADLPVCLPPMPRITADGH